VVALSKCDAVDDPELLDLVELEVRELLKSYGFPGDDLPVVRVSALKALQGDPSGVETILKLMEALDDHDDVQNVWANFDIEEKEIEASLA